MKERVTLTIEKELLGRIDDTIDNQSVKNRSHAVELLLRKALRGKVPPTAVILAGGKDSQTMSLVQGKPLLLHNIELLKRYGVTDVIIVGGKYERIHKFFGDGREAGIRISYVEEKKPLGTAGCLHILRERLTEPFIMLNGDDLKNVNLTKLFHAHNQYHGTITIALTPVHDPTGYGVAVLDGNNILHFVEKADEAPSTLVNAGVYIMEPEVTRLVPEGFSMLEENVFPVLAREGKLFGYPFSGQWIRTKSSKDLQKAQKLWRGS